MTQKYFFKKNFLLAFSESSKLQIFEHSVGKNLGIGKADVRLESVLVVIRMEIKMDLQCLIVTLFSVLSKVKNHKLTLKQFVYSSWVTFHVVEIRIQEHTNLNGWIYVHFSIFFGIQFSNLKRDIIDGRFPFGTLDGYLRNVTWIDSRFITSDHNFTLIQKDHVTSLLLTFTQLNSLLT